MQMFRTTDLKRNLLAALLTVALFGAVFSAISVEAFSKHSNGKKNDMTTADPTVVMTTTKGTIKVEIFKTDAPITSQNFLDLVERGFYNGLSFHRYEPGFCIQGGDPRGNGTGGFVDPATNTERTIQLEVSPKLKHSEAGMIAMARSSDPNSASSQFYFTLGPASFLDGQYAVFGKVTEGLNVVKELRKGDKMTKVSVLETVSK
jgi:peptidyl-prolyl cis-trans isomerase B (cyclophilin B)